MAIIGEEIKWYHPENRSDLAACGGRMTNMQMITNVKNNIFPDITDSQRTAGFSRFRKAFGKIANADNLTLFNAVFYLKKHSPGDDYFLIIPGTQTDTKPDPEPTKWFGAATLVDDVSAGLTSFLCELQHIDANIFANGEFIWIGDNTNGEFHKNVTVSVSGQQVVIQLEAGDQLVNSYSNANTTVSSVIDFGDIKTSVDNYYINSFSGNYDYTTYPVECSNIGTIESSWQIEFVSTDAFNLIKDSQVVSNGSITTDFIYMNPVFNKPFFRVLGSGWSGNFNPGDTFSFITHPASKAIWFKHVVPPGAGAVSSDSITWVLTGDTT